MMFVIGYFLLSVVIAGIIFLFIEHSPSGFEDETGFHLNPESAPQLKHSVKQYQPYSDFVFGNSVTRHAHN